MNLAQHPFVLAACLVGIDDALLVLSQWLREHPERRQEITERIDGALDERLRLMALRAEAGITFHETHRQSRVVATSNKQQKQLIEKIS